MNYRLLRTSHGFLIAFALTLISCFSDLTAGNILDGKTDWADGWVVSEPGTAMPSATLTI